MREVSEKLYVWLLLHFIDQKVKKQDILLQILCDFFNMECIDPGSSDKHWDYPEGWLLLSEPPQWAPLTMTASPSAMAQTEGQFHENGGSVNVE